MKRLCLIGTADLTLFGKNTLEVKVLEETRKEVLKSKLTRVRNEFRNMADIVVDSTGVGYLKAIDDICGMYEEYITEIIKDSYRRHDAKGEKQVC
jgi:hypothetical protein